VLPTGAAYAQVYVANESNVPVWFDDVKIEHWPGLQVQETHYDPFGLDLAGLSHSTPELRTLNQYQWNGKEKQSDFGLGWTHLDWRFFDAQTGRFHTVDPLSDVGQEMWSTYQFGFDNAIRYNDPDGRNPGGDDPPVERAVTYAVGVANAVIDNIFGTDLSGSIDPTYGSAYSAGQRDGNTASVVAGALMMVHGAQNVEAGGAVVLASATIEASSAGTLTVVAGPGVAAGATLAGAGLLEGYVGSRLFANGAKKQGSQQRENADGNNKPTRSERAQEKKAQKTGGSKSSANSQYGEGAEHTKNGNKPEKHQKAEASRKQSRGGEKADASRVRYQDSKKTRRT